MRNLLTVLLLTSAAIGIGQSFSSDNPDYIRLVTLGEASMLEGKADSCLHYYQAAFAIKHSSVLSTMRASVCAYMNGDSSLLDYYLDTAFVLGYDNAQSIFNNWDQFQPWQETTLDKEISRRYNARVEELGLDMALMQKLKEIRTTDQEQRQHMRGISDKYGWDSPQMDSLWQLQNYSDSVNTTFITSLLDERGYPGKSVVGSSLAGTAFLVIQHAPHETQLNYLDMITGAADDGEVNWRSVALLVDRVRLGNDEPQLYGSQVYRDTVTNAYYFGPIAYPEKVDSMRGTVGLGPLQSYADNWNFVWDVNSHKERHGMK